MIINFCKGDDDFYEQGTRETRRARERAPANDEKREERERERESESHSALP